MVGAQSDMLGLSRCKGIHTHCLSSEVTIMDLGVTRYFLWIRAVEIKQQSA